MKRWWLVIALLLSLGMNVGILAIMGLHRLGRPQSPPDLAATEGAARLARVADWLELEGDKRSRFLELQTEFLLAAEETRERVKRAKIGLRRQAMSRRPDRGQLDRLERELAEALAHMDRIFVDNVIATRGVLTRSQERKFFRILGRLRSQTSRDSDPLRARPGQRR